MFESVNRNPGARELKKFAWTLLAGMPVVGALWTAIIWWSQDHWNGWIFIVFASVGGVAWGLSLMSKRTGRAIYLVWHWLGAIIEATIRFISTWIMYYLTLVPIGLIMRLFGRKPLPLAFDRNKKTYWKDCQETKDLKRYFRQY